MKRTAIIVLFLTMALAAVAQVSPAAKSAFFTTTDGVKLHYLEAGSGKPIVFVPGWTMPAWIWEPQLKELSKKYHVIALDPRSQGESDKPSDGNYYVRRAEDVRDLIAHKKLDRPVLVGWSLAVPELVYFAEHIGSQNVGGYVLVDGMLWDKPNPDMSGAMQHWLLQMHADRDQWTDTFVRSMYKKPQSEGYLKRVMTASKRTPTNSAVALISMMGAINDWTPILKKIHSPVMFAFAPDTQKTADLVKANIPSARIEEFNDCGHALFVDDPTRFNNLIDEFVSGLSTGTNAGR